jgi:hypothetical protein
MDSNVNTDIKTESEVKTENSADANTPVSAEQTPDKNISIRIPASQRPPEFIFWQG